MSHGDFEVGQTSAAPEPASGNPATQDHADEPRVRFVRGPVPAASGAFNDPGATASEQAYGGSGIDQALKPVNTPPPQPTHVTSGVKVATDRAPTDREVLDPPRPAMDGASQGALVDSVAGIVDDIYNDVLFAGLDRVKTELSRVPPPPETPLALEIIGAIAEGIAVATVGVIGKLAIDAVKDQLGRAAGPALDGIKAIGKEAGAEAKRDAAGTAEPIASHPGDTLLEEFFLRERRQLRGKQQDINDILRLIRQSSARNVPHELAILDDRLKSLYKDPALSAWFEHKVTMEWMNFCARLSLGPREPGQMTDMPGANEIGGARRAGRRGLEAWNGGPEGAIDITVDVAFDSEDAPVLQLLGARTHSPGATKILRDASHERDEQGRPYTLATLPVYRSVWLKTSDSRLDTVLAFVITPEGAIEADLDNPTLAEIGAGRQGDDVPAGDAMIGAHVVTSLLGGVGTEQLQ